jgi:hypothetical protein
MKTKRKNENSENIETENYFGHPCLAPIIAFLMGGTISLFVGNIYISLFVSYEPLAGLVLFWTIPISAFIGFLLFIFISQIPPKSDIDTILWSIVIIAIGNFVYLAWFFN